MNKKKSPVEKSRTFLYIFVYQMKKMYKFLDGYGMIDTLNC